MGHFTRLGTHGGMRLALGRTPNGPTNQPGNRYVHHADRAEHLGTGDGNNSGPTRRHLVVGLNLPSMNPGPIAGTILTLCLNWAVLGSHGLCPSPVTFAVAA